jgi:hypothetical protein
MKTLCAVNPPLCAAAHKGSYVMSAVMLSPLKLSLIQLDIFPIDPT